MELNFGSWLKHQWNAFLDRKPYSYRADVGPGYTYRLDRPRMSRGNERSIITSVFNRVALDVAAINIKHVRLDENRRYTETIDSRISLLDPSQCPTVFSFHTDFLPHYE